MAKRGRKPFPEAMHVVRGTFKRNRARASVVPPLEREPEAPAWLTGAALAIWQAKIATYRQRGAKLAGCESALAQYCAVEALLVAKFAAGVEPSAGLINAYRIFAGEFHDTPASQLSAGAKADPGNRFTRNAPPSR